MIIDLRRHGDRNRKTGGLTRKSEEEAKRLFRDGKYKRVFSAEPYRCQELAWIISGEWPVASNAFNDLELGEDIGKRIQSMILIIRNSVSPINSPDKVLVLTHSNLIAAIEYFLDGKEIPQNLDDLPVILYLKGIRINISKQKI